MMLTFTAWGTFLHHVKFVPWDPRVLFCKPTIQLVSPQPVLLHLFILPRGHHYLLMRGSSLLISSALQGRIELQHNRLVH